MRNRNTNNKCRERGWEWSTTIHVLEDINWSFIKAKFNARNIQPITKYSYFYYKENDDVVFKFEVTAQPAFLQDVTSVLKGRSKQKMCRASLSVLPRAF